MENRPMNLETIPVAILGATGAVGQKLIRLIAEQERFRIAELAASERNTGKTYAEACTWREIYPLPQNIARMKLCSAQKVCSPYVLSAVPASIAQDLEPSLASRGLWVVSNASSHRMRDDIPLLIPEVNPEHLELLDKQTTSGRIITNPNCATVFIALALKPLSQLGVIEHVSVVTMQAISGAGYPGVPSCDILGNIIPNIAGEEEKIECELKKILGSKNEAADFSVTAHTNRVPVQHGHMSVIHVHFAAEISDKELRDKLLETQNIFPGVYQLYDEAFSPQARQNLSDTDKRVHIGRIKTNRKIIGMTVLGHNLVRGAAGAALLNLEAVLKSRELCVS
jgi:aspartate-semialdehyde dehydrogenase